MHRIFRFRLAMVVLAAPVFFLTACQKPKYPAGLYAEVRTNKGLIVLELEFEKTPMTVANFVGLAEGTITNAAFPAGTPYFNGTKWHRVVPGHVIQCGIPRSDRTDGPGYEFPNEIRPDLSHNKAGMVNMANGGPHTNASQWCITLGDRSYLDGDYTVFGHVVEGLDVVLSIIQGDEVQSLKIVRVGKAAAAFRPTTESFQKMVEEAKVRVAKADAEKKAREENLIRTGWPGASDGGKGVKFIILKEGKGQPLVSGANVEVAYSGQCLLTGKSFVSTADEGKPYWGAKPEAFVFNVGTSLVNPGFNAAVAQMKIGEKRVVIIPADQGYKTSGFYARQRPGEKRFVISPNTVLVYEIEVIALGPPAKK